MHLLSIHLDSKCPNHICSECLSHIHHGKDIWPRSLLACLVPTAQPYSLKNTILTWQQPPVVQYNWHLSHPATIPCNCSQRLQRPLTAELRDPHTYTAICRDLIMISSYFCSGMNYRICSLKFTQAKIIAICHLLHDVSVSLLRSKCFPTSLHPPMAPARLDLSDQSLAEAFLALLRWHLGFDWTALVDSLNSKIILVNGQWFFTHETHWSRTTGLSSF